MSTVTIREHWASRVGFIMATAGSAIGLGSLWRFPYVAGSTGGGAFVLLYLIFTFLIGLPVFIAELIVGRKSQKSAILSYQKVSKGHSENWRLLGWLNVLTCAIIISYYAVTSGWCLCYVMLSLTNFTAGKSPAAIQGVFDILAASPGMNLFWFVLILLINVGILIGGVRKGIEHWSKILMPALFVILIALCCYSLTMKGAGEALSFLFSPDIGKLGASGILEALGMSFFTLSVGMGILVTYGSYMKPEENIPANGALIAFMVVLVSILSAITIFSITFSFGFAPEQGTGLIFKTLPVLFHNLPATILLSTIFFILVLFAAITSTISLLEVLIANLTELTSLKRNVAAWAVAAFIFILGVPSALARSHTLFSSWQTIYGRNFFETMDFITANWFIPIGGLLVMILVGWRMDKDTVLAECIHGSNAQWFVKPWFFVLKWIAPVIMLIIILQKAGLLPFLV